MYLRLKFQTENSSLNTASGAGLVVTREREEKKPAMFLYPSGTQYKCYAIHARSNKGTELSYLLSGKL